MAFEVLRTPQVRDAVQRQMSRTERASYDAGRAGRLDRLGGRGCVAGGYKLAATDGGDYPLCARHYCREPGLLRGVACTRWRSAGRQTSRCAMNYGIHFPVGCGDGALLSELHRRNFGGRLSGVEITQAAVSIARMRPEIDSVELYDGSNLEVPDETYELGLLSHVLEHVPDPPALLAEVARACRAVLVEVPLEDNVSAKRASKREHAEEVGHLQRLSRDSARLIVARAGLRIACELEDPLPLTAHRFFAPTPSAGAAATAKWPLRAGLHRLAPSTAQRLLTVYYACLCIVAE